MNRKFYKLLVLLTALLPFTLNAQMDTLLFEGFQGNWEERTIEFYDDVVYGNDSIWINLDADGAPNAQNDFQSWYISLDFGSPDTIPPADSNFVAASVSWMEDPSVQNYNWMILPPLQLVDGQATLSWKSAPFQGPRYMDGYTVVASTEEVDPFFGTYTDTLFQAAQMLTPLPDGAYDIDGGALEVDSFLWSPGYIHADGFTIMEYFDWDGSSDAYDPLLEPHTISLADYAGQTVYIAFLHDSFDDNIISVDDILVRGNLVGSAEEADEARLRWVTYPNPVDNYLNVLFRLEQAAVPLLELYDMNGRLMLQARAESRRAGEQHLDLDLRRLPAGTYNLVLDIEGQKHTRKVVKR
ncbi:MAG: T9SS type A sorting domain-containing protein [Phaeodactylibacter sp.]|nr:T9SS type A sorting domain-containing protein [Phaeodactylibacter sp.]